MGLLSLSEKQQKYAKPSYKLQLVENSFLLKEMRISQTNSANNQFTFNFKHISIAIADRMMWCKENKS